MIKKYAVAAGGRGWPMVAVCAAAALPLATASAQDTTDAADATPTTAASGQLGPVLVTAERRVENIKDVPQSISTLSGETLDVLTSGGDDVRLLAARVPSLNIESSFGRAFPRFYIRGYGNTDFDLNASQPVSLVYDDVVQENPILKGFPIFDVQQVEVFRGPQGTLFGRNTPAGIVKFDSVAPQQHQEGYLNASEATFNTSNIEGAYNVGLGGGWAVRFSALYQHRDDFVGNTYTHDENALEGYDDTAARFQVLYAPTRDFSALFNVHGRYLNGTARLFRANIFSPGSNDLVANFDPSKVAEDGSNAQHLHSYGSNLRLRWALDGVTLNSISGYETVGVYSRGDIDGGYGASFAPPSGPGFIPFPSESADALPHHKQLTQEFRVESNDKGPLQWQSGLYYYFEDITIDSFDYNTLAHGVQDGFAEQHQLNNAWALFGSVNYAFTDAFTLRAGVRYTEDRKDFSAFRTESPTGDGATPVLTAHPNAYKVNWDTSATYALNQSVNLYARIANGFRAPSIQGRLVFSNDISVANSENDLSYEAGVKADLFHKRANVAFNLFRYDVHNQQLTAVGGASNVARLLNAQKSSGQGAELDLKAYLASDLLVTLSGSYNFTKIEDPNLAVAVCHSGCTVTDPTINGGTEALIDGNPLPQAPRWVGNATVRYGIPLANGAEFFALTDWSYRSDISFFLYQSKEYTGKSLLTGGLRVGYDWANGKYEIAAFSRNITNQIVATGGIDFNNLTGFINDPRIFGVQLKTTF